MIDITGFRSGKLVAICKTDKKDTKGNIIWKCKCDCGKVCYVASTKIKTNHTKSCGCLQKEKLVERNKSRSKYPEEIRNTRLYRIWKGMIARTTYPSQDGYKNYGGRGIEICNEWINDFYSFYNWSLSNGYADNLLIDRLDNNRGYSPDNCRWVSRKEQNNNQRSNVVIEYKNEKHTAAQWADIIGISHDTIYKRIHNKCPIESILKEYVENRKE